MRVLRLCATLCVALPLRSPAREPLIEIPVPPIDFALRDDPVFRNLLAPPDFPPAPQLPVEPSLFPDMDGPWFPPENPVADPGDNRLLPLALKVAPAVVSVRVWDAFGAELSSGVGAMVAPNGVILTDAELLHPALAGEIDYITVLTGTGTSYRVEEILHHDMATGVALLGVAASEAPHLELASDHDFGGNPGVTMVALHPSEGLSLNDATVAKGATPSLSGWLTLSGTDSPGAIGSPVFNADGRIVAVIALHVPLDRWTNFALPVTTASTLLATGNRGAGRSLEAFRRTVHTPVARDGRFLAAWEKITAQHYKGAAKDFLALTRRFPREAACWALLALASNEVGDAPEAAASARMAVALDPAIGEHWRNFAALGGGDREDGTLDSGTLRGSLEAATESLPRDRHAWLALAESYVRDLQWHKAERALRHVISLDADNGKALYLLACAQGKLGMTGEAQAAVLRAVRVRPKDAEAWFLMGLLFTESGEPARAAEAFEKVVALEPKHPTAWMNLARAWKAAGNGTKAQLAFRKYQESAP